ncbi:BZ3500_MvSof-1268-A1-R1_Chr8-1g09823 [Microbotryum saponariae]|uniref:BZ3500_MvSof-1268-A1-R1_Chr8-1g09823 protein n=1 Tax=Microbotryum saponariae TaxID=289078 RepID=A0A2X0KVF6_9BASI|nr:BZ3500_MvSof-1268-A1-R1_Chr8-1g09823 [Microbotryum saponariae]SDA08109.1 BZ3501_MvSof-1269-A2-R1_Chr8-1g09546 [Microbotryum saponariae]
MTPTPSSNLQCRTRPNWLTSHRATINWQRHKSKSYKSQAFIAGPPNQPALYSMPMLTDPDNRLKGQHRNFLFEPYCNWAESKLKTGIRINAKANMGVVDQMRLQGGDNRLLYHDNPRVYHVMVRLHKIMTLTYPSASFDLDSQLRFSFVWLSEFLSKGLEWSQEWRSMEVLG